MAGKLSHRERIQTIIAGEKPDRFAASFWRHFFHMESTVDGLVEAMLYFQKRFDWDFMKINPRADYHVEDWGLRQTYSKQEFEKHVKTAFPVEKIEDWEKIQPLSPTAGVLGDHLKAVSLIRKQSDKELPIFMTMFTPLAIAGRMVRDDRMLVEHLRSEPERMLRALRVITDTFKKYVEELRNAGADGLFLATTAWASKSMLTWEEYETFGVPFDLKLAHAAGPDALNLLHVCGAENFLKEISKQEYPCALVNWDASNPTNLPIDRATPYLGNKVPVGGFDYRGWLLLSEPDEVAYQVDRLKQANSPADLIFGPGCAIAPETSMENLQAIRDRL